MLGSLNFANVTLFSNSHDCTKLNVTLVSFLTYTNQLFIKVQRPWMESMDPQIWSSRKGQGPYCSRHIMLLVKGH